MNHNARLKGSAPNGERPTLLRSNISREIKASLVALGGAVALVLLSGCASAHVQADSDSWEYNSNTGYPAVGAGPSWHL
jgi:hypothetical protein